MTHGCTRILWNTSASGLALVGRNEDYVSASEPSFVVTPRGRARRGSVDAQAAGRTARWTVRYGSVAIYANNRFPNDGMNEAGLTARTLYYVDGDPNERAAPGTDKRELDADHWVSFVLDGFDTVAKAVDALRSEVYLVSVQGEKGFAYATPKHLAMADATGDSAIIEVRNGRIEIFHGREYRILTNPPAYEDHLRDAEHYRNAAKEDLPSTWTSSDRFVRADYWVRNLPEPRNGDAATAYGFMYSILGNVAIPVGLPESAEDQTLLDDLKSKLSESDDSYGLATYFQTLSDLTNKHYRFKSLLAPSDVFFDLRTHDFGEGQPVQAVKRIDRYAQMGWSGDISPQMSALDGDIDDQ